MLTDAAVLTLLSHRLSPGELPDVLRRLLRVPEAWAALHRPGFVPAAVAARDLTPQALASRALGLATLPPASGSLSESLRARVRSVAEDGTPPGPVLDIELVGLRALVLLNDAASADGATAILARLQADPAIWRSPLACAWSALPNRDAVLSTLLRGQKEDLVLSAINALLSHASPAEAARQLAEGLGGSADALIPMLMRQGETAVAQAIGARDLPGSKVVDQNASPERLRLIAARQLSNGDPAGAQSTLARAWDAARTRSSDIAFDLADAAHHSGDDLMEIEALRQAVQAQPTPERRARLAMALAAQRRPKDALAELPDEPQSMEEKIAAGVALLASGEPEKGMRWLGEAAQAAGQGTVPHTGLLKRLTVTLKAARAPGGAALVAEIQAKVLPGDADAQLRLASLLDEAGDAEPAAAHAALALALQPENADARRHLAKALMSAGQPEAALPHWRALAAEKIDDRASMAECAVLAGQSQLALETSNSILAADPSNGPAMVTLGRAQTAMGEIEASRRTLDMAIAQHPELEGGWIALTDCLDAAGDPQAAGATLAAAVQTYPGNGALLHAHALWLEKQGRWSEALEAAEKSIHASSANPIWLADYGDLLRRLGHPDRAASVLQDAHSRRPGNWTTALALARSLEARDEGFAAAKVMLSMEEPVPDVAALDFGRILLAYPDSGDSSGVARALAALEQATRKGPADPQLGYWFGLANERSGRTSEAMDSYRPYLDDSNPVEPAVRLKAIQGFSRCASATGQIPLALTTLEGARSRFPDSPELLVALSETYLASELPREALASARMASDLDAKSPQILNVLSTAAMRAGEPEAAQMALERQAELDPASAQPHLALARLYVETDRREAARLALARSLSLGREQVDILRLASELQGRMGNRKSAYRLLRRAVGMSPNDRMLLRELAEASEQGSDSEGAREAWSRLAEAEPEDPQVLQNAAKANWVAGRRSAAIGYWQRALTHNPTDSAIHRALANAYLAENDIDRSLHAYSSALELDPANADLALEAGQAALRHGALKQAKTALEAAIKARPDRPEPWTRLGECWLMLGNAPEARAALESACRVAPDAVEPPALLASALWIQGDLAGAGKALATVRQREPESAAAAAALIRSAVHMAEWAVADQTVDAAIKTWPEEPSLAMEACRTWVRLAEAGVLLRQMAEVRFHAPSTATPGDDAFQRVTTTIQKCERLGQWNAEARQLRLRAALAFERADAATFAEAEAAAANDPSGEMREGLAIAHLRAHRPADAMACLRGWAEARSASEWSALLFGVAKVDEGQFDDARRALLDAGQNPVLRPVTDFLIGRSWLADGQTEKYTEHMSQALLAWPEEPAWHYQLANAYLEQGHPDAALPHLQQAVDLAPDEGDFRLALARALRDTGQLSQATKTFAEVLHAMPAIGAVWKEAGLCALSGGDGPRALPWLERAGVMLPSDTDCMVGLARAAMHLGRSKDAQDHIQAAYRVAPEDPEVLLAFGEVMARQGKFEKAIQAYDRASHRSPDSLAIKVARGRLLVSVGRAGQAAQELAAIVEAHAEDDEAWAALAEAQDAAGKKEEAIASAARAADLAPSKPRRRMALGHFCRKAGQLDRALSELGQAQAAAPSDPLVWLEIGQVYEDRREFKKSLDAYQRAIDLDGNNAPAHLRAGLVLKGIKAYPQAGRMLQRAVDLNPKDPDALHQLAAVRALELVHGAISQQAVSL